MKLYQLNKSDKFKFNYLGSDNLIGKYLGTDGMYAKVQWEGRDYNAENPYSFLAAYLEVEVIFEQSEGK